MKEKIVKEVKLENDQTLVIKDASRMISKNAYFVKLKASIEIPVKMNLFSENENKEFFFDDLIDAIGSVAVYEFVAERNFIMVDEKDKLFEKLQNDFFETLGKYISKPEFPKKFILKLYKDHVKNNQKR